MDSSSRKIVAVIAIGTLVILGVMAGNFYADSDQPEGTAAVEPPAPQNDDAEAAIAAGTKPNTDSEFASDVPKSEEIPAIDGKPSMVFENDTSNNAPAALESTKGTSEPATEPTVKAE